jgi:hypothetical protein
MALSPLRCGCGSVQRSNDEHSNGFFFIFCKTNKNILNNEMTIISFDLIVFFLGIFFSPFVYWPSEQRCILQVYTRNRQSGPVDRREAATAQLLTFASLIFAEKLPFSSI